MLGEIVGRGTLPYRNQVLALAAAFRDTGRNPRWVRQVLQGDIPLATVVTQTPRERFPELYYDHDQRVHERQARKQPQVPQSDTGEPCPKCRSRNTTYTLLQTRRADEGATEYWYCRQCNKRWKGGG